LGQPNEAKQKAIMTKYGEQLQASMSKCVEQIQRIKTNEPLNAVLGKPLDDLAMFSAHSEVEVQH
jgi:hypothetical protein